MGSFLGSALGSVVGGVSSIIGGALSNSAARHAATVANQRNIYNYQHRYQWAMEDMQKAGLNPMLAATQGIGSFSRVTSGLSTHAGSNAFTEIIISGKSRSSINRATNTLSSSKHRV